MFRLFLSSILLITLGSIATPFTSATEEKAAPQQCSPKPRPVLDNGLYLVVRSSRNVSEVHPIKEGEILIPNDFHLLEPEEREPVLYLVLQAKPFVPFHLAGAPTEDKETATGKPRLQLQLAAEQQKPLEDFTRQHLNDTVAIVIGNDVVTTHKVKSAITGGKLQITRCTKHGCETLYTGLLRGRGSK